MHPELFRIGSFALPSYGLMMAVAFVAGLWLLRRRAPSFGIEAETASDIGVWLLLSGLVVRIPTAGLRNSSAHHVPNGQDHDVEPCAIGPEVVAVVTRASNQVRGDQDTSHRDCVDPKLRGLKGLLRLSRKASDAVRALGAVPVLGSM